MDPSVAVLVDVQNTLCNNAILRWGSDAQKAKYFPKLASKWVGAYALSEAGSGSDAFALACRAEDKGDHYELTGQKLWITNAGEAELFIVMANLDPSKGYKGITSFLVERTFPGFTVGKKEDKLGIRASSTCELVLERCRVPKENVLGEPGQGLQDRDRDPQRGPHRDRGADGRPRPGGLRARGPVRAGAAAVRQAHRRVPGRAVRARRDGDPDRGGAAAHLQRGAPARRRAALRQGVRDGEAVRLAGRRAGGQQGDRGPRRVRLHPGVPDREVLPRPEGGPDLRGHHQHAAAGHRQADPREDVRDQRAGQIPSGSSTCSGGSSRKRIRDRSCRMADPRRPADGAPRDDRAPAGRRPLRSAAGRRGSRT